MPTIIDHLAFSYGERKIFADLSLAVADSDRVWLSAPSGFGKTTLLRLVCGLEKPENGQISGTGGKRIAAVFQDDRLIPWLSASENICAVLGNLPRGERKKAAAEALAAVGLEKECDSMPSSLSGGMARRVAIARALSYGGAILLLDQPFAGIDGEWRERIAKAIIERFKNSAILLATHHDNEAELLNARKVELSDL